jgi:hypothetical protein
MDDRIRLAEAMELDLTIEWQDAAGHWHESERQFDPFTDANDDYACLEWMRIHCGVEPDYAWAEKQSMWNEFSCELDDGGGAYQIGDYARAALKVLPDMGKED